MTRLSRATVARLYRITTTTGGFHCPCCQTRRDHRVEAEHAEQTVLAWFGECDPPPPRPEPGDGYTGPHCPCCDRPTAERTAKERADLETFLDGLRARHDQGEASNTSVQTDQT